jgi:adenosylcobinamide-GDP ribazoletransferase
MSDAHRDPTDPAPPARHADDLARALRFFSRLPVPVLPGERDPHAAPDFASLPRVLPVAGLVIALPAVAALALGAWFAVPPLAAAALAIAVLIATTGGLHEDGLADTADGFGAPGSLERRLAIMADSRIGAFGAAALALALLVRVALLAALLEKAGPSAACAALLAASAASRAGMAVPLWLLPSARPGGRSASVGRPGGTAMAICIGLAAALVLALTAGWAGPGRGAWAIVLCGALALAMTAWSRRMLGGQTGDVAGATQVACEIAVLLVLASG